MMTHASGEYSAEPLSAIGSKPPIAVSVVNSTGTKRISPAFCTLRA
jgi:hypothetical protein